MDRDQQELKSIGFSAILKKTFKIIYKERNIFAKITPSFILPLTIILLGYPQFNFYITNIKMRIINEVVFQIVYILLALAGMVFSLVFFLLPTSAIIYTLACIYTAKQLTFKTILRVMPKAWRRLMVTFAIQFLIMLAYNIVTILALLPPVIWLYTKRGKYLLTIFLVILAVIYLVGFVYISLIWSLANVVTLLEDLKGYGAIKKSKALLKGKRLLASALFALVGLPLVVVLTLYILILAFEGRGGLYPFTLELNLYIYTYGRGWKSLGEDCNVYYRTCNKVGFGVILSTVLLILHVLFLLGLVIQTIFYFVCKSYHHEIIDKSYLADHLDNLLPAAAYVPPVEKNVELEQHSDV